MSHDKKNTEQELVKVESNKTLSNDIVMINKSESTKPLNISSHDKKEKKLSQRKMLVAEPKKTKRKYNYPNNFVSTSKYNLITFFPKALLYQFTRYANIYFLMIAIIQLIPAVSPLSPITAIAPLTIVLLISIVREGIEDYYRHVSDEKENTEVVLKFDGRNFIEDLSKNLEVGDIVKVEEYGVIPADLILISCKNLNKIAYLETANLDGEKNLKPKNCIAQIFNMFKDIDNCVRIKATIVFENPNSDLSKFNGRLKINYKHDYSVNIKQLLYKGTILKNTPWAIGVVVYTGKETKIILNSQKQSSKTSHLEDLVNFLILFIFLFQLCLCIVLAIICSLWNRSSGMKTNYYLIQNTDPNILGLISFWSYLLLLNTMIPISLIVSIEIVKYAQGFFMNNDIELYSTVKDKYKLIVKLDFAK
jgi:phospholipid-transporting ATPase